MFLLTRTVESPAGSPAVITLEKLRGTLVIRAWEETLPLVAHGHTKIVAGEDLGQKPGTWWGDIGSRRTPPDVAKMKEGRAKVLQVAAHRATAHRVAYATVERAYPDLRPKPGGDLPDGVSWLDGVVLVDALPPRIDVLGVAS